MEPFFNNGKELRNITDANPLLQKNEECHHQIVILDKIVNDTASLCKCAWVDELLGDFKTAYNF